MYLPRAHEAWVKPATSKRTYFLPRVIDVEEEEEVKDARNTDGRARAFLLLLLLARACASCNFVPTAFRAAVRRCGRRVAEQKTTQSRFERAGVVAKSGSRQSTIELDSERSGIVALLIGSRLASVSVF